MVSKNIIANVKNSIGQVFTPDYVSKFMVENILKYFNDQKVKVLEPSVGEGVFIDALLQNNLKDITAYEIDKNLELALLEKYPSIKFNFTNFLGSNVIEKFDLIIGNPPYLGQNYNSEIFQDYIKRYPICDKYFVGNMDLFYFFIHQAIKKLKPGGILSFITTNYWITKSKKTGIKLLKPHVLNECFILQYIDLSNLKMFKDAKGQHNCIFIFQKKTKEQKLLNIDKEIHIISIKKRPESFHSDDEFNREIFNNLMDNHQSDFIIKYKSAITNNELIGDGSWNLLYPEKAKSIINKIEAFCIKNDQISFLKDYFVIRNGIIFIKDDIFILNEGKNLIIKDDQYNVKINDEFVKLSEKEGKRLKKIYKSKAIQPYGHIHQGYIGHAIYFNKNKYRNISINQRNSCIEKEYPVLTAYLLQFKKDLQDILINAKENPLDLFFPRRGAFIRNISENLVDLEPLYEKSNKIFFKYISSGNKFGFSNSSYFSTSDTYFLWPIREFSDIFYRFLIAYLNSKLVTFIFKAKNIEIKRSKTKLEDGIPIPNLESFTSEKDESIITLITLLSSWLLLINTNSVEKQHTNIISRCKYFILLKQEELLKNILFAIQNGDQNLILNTIDILLFQLFDIKEKDIDSLLKKFY